MSGRRGREENQKQEKRSCLVNTNYIMCQLALVYQCSHAAPHSSTKNNVSGLTYDLH